MTDLAVKVGGLGRSGIGLFYPAQPSGGVLVHLDQLQQSIDGFGASDRNSVALDATLADLFFDQTVGIGLSLLRTPIFSDGSGTTANNLTRAAARGAKIWAAPWTAPGAWKDNGSDVGGGHLLSGHYTDWATRMAGFQATINAASGVNLYALSIQNEPDYTPPPPSYSSMIYDTAEMVAFIKVLGPLVKALTPPPLIILPEVSNAGLMADFVTAIQADATALSYLDIVAWHQYAGNNGSPIVGFPNWQTEMSYFNSFDATMTTALAMCADIHAALTTGNVSAWHYWELTGAQSDNEGLIGHDGGTQVTKRVYALGNWSKFVRPGHYRVTTTGTVSGVNLTAFVNTTNRSYVVVAVNTNGGSASLSAGMYGSSASTVIPWTTSASLDLAQQSPISCPGGVFSAMLPANSVTSFASN